MGTVTFDISMSLDGYFTATGVTAEEPVGAGGQVLTEWAMGGDPTSSEVAAAAVSDLGAIICGRRTYDTSLPWWKADGPTGPARVPLFVVTHRPAGEVPDNGVYTFTDGIESALQQARAAAGDRDVAVMGGADIGRQFIRAGLVDRIGIHLVPVLFGAGQRLFDDIGPEHIRLEVVSVAGAAKATHLVYRVVK
ncbi:dihydrofolate reductase family protein [Pseudonocardia humida]|uniref:Dihydrofolate reductase n=1 Tax=Pseudonocardia humida TaxID=2800819 RepID=A0ABT1A6A4_9PSEU|nr:dihydrofolate reductase family protein [Pseudonocardia humida]MCO1658538.1 dihydrofolate reductase [Pseudonocardia humida]